MDLLRGVDYGTSFHIDEFRGNPKLLHCDCGYSPQAGSIIGLMKSHKWALVVKCGACSARWCVCVSCHRALKKFQVEGQLNCHHRHYHRHSNNLADQKGHKKMKMWKQSKKSIFDDMNTLLHHRRTKSDMMVTDPRKIDSHWIPIVRGDTLGFNSNNNGQKFFQFCIERTNQEESIEEANMPNLGGLEYLLHKCQLGRDINPAVAKNNLFLPPEKVKLGISIAKLAFLHTSTSRGFLAETLHDVYKLGCEYGWYAAADSINKDFNHRYSPQHFFHNFIIEEMLPPFAMEKIQTGSDSVAVAIPTNANDIRNRYFDSIYSIAKNLPCPPIQEDIPGHAYRSIIDCARHFMAHLPSIGKVQTISFPLKGFNGGTVSHTSQSKRAFQIFQNAMARNEECNHMDIMFVIGLSFWGDDVDPGSFIMQGRASMWIKTVTFGTPLDDGNRAENTYPIAIGRKGECHDLVEARINNDLARLRDPKKLGPFFIGCQKKMAHCYFEVERQLGDQPERRVHTYFAHGGSRFGARFGVSANHRVLYRKKRLKACGQCQKLLLERYQNEQWDLPIPSCLVCLNWDALLDSPLNLIPVPEDYPLVRDNDDNFIGIPGDRIVKREGELYLKPVVVTFGTMRTAVDLAYDGYCNYGWSRKNCDMFLQVEGFNQLIIDRIMLHTIRAHSLVVAVGEEKEELDEAAQADPAAYQKMPDPPSWVRPGSTIEDHLEAIMHELFHGGVSSVMDLIQVSCKRRGCNPAFIKKVQAQMAPLLDISCDWLKLKMYKGEKFAGFISENYLAYARIFPWLYQNYSECLPTGDPHKDKPPIHLPFEKWTKKNLAYWLRVRGLSTKGDKPALKYRAGTYLIGGSGLKIPPVLPVPEISEEVIGSLVAATSNFIGCCMSPQVTGSTIKKLNYAVRIFLSAYDNLDSKLRRKKEECSVVSKYNFLCMMNLPAMMESLGPLPFLWEGKNQGEGYLRKVKGTYYGGMMKNENWPVDMMKHISQCVEMDLLLPKKEEGQKVIQTESALNDRSRKFARVSCFDEVQSRIKECNRVKKKPVPVILLENGPEVHRMVRVFVVLPKMGEDYLVEIKRATNVEGGGVLTKEKMGLVYHKFDIAQPSLKGELTWKSLLSLMVSPRLGYGCLLPLLDKANDEDSRLFALISNSWTSLRPNKTMADLIVDDPYLRSINI